MEKDKNKDQDKQLDDDEDKQSNSDDDNSEENEDQKKGEEQSDSDDIQIYEEDDDEKEEIIDNYEGEDAPIDPQDELQILAQSFQTMNLEEKQRKQEMKKQMKVFNPFDDITDGQSLEYESSEYDINHEMRLAWSSLSFDYMRHAQPAQPLNRISYPLKLRVFVGTQADNDQKNRIELIEARRLHRTQKDKTDEDEESSSDDDLDDTFEEEDPLLRNFSVPHIGCVNKIRSMPQDSRICASYSSSGQVSVFNMSPLVAYWDSLVDEEVRELLEQNPNQIQKGDNELKQDVGKRRRRRRKGGVGINQQGLSFVKQRLNKPDERKMKPAFIYKEHAQEGYALDWSQLEAMRIASGDNSGCIRVWSPSEQSSPQSSSSSQQSNFEFIPSNSALHTIYHAHNDTVEDVKWSPFNPNMLLSCSSDGSIHIYDLLCKAQQLSVKGSNSKKNNQQSLTPIHAIESAHGTIKTKKGKERITDVNVVDWNKYQNHLFASGGDDGAVCVWDIRNMERAMMRLAIHKDQITAVEWSHHCESLILVAGADHRVSVWDFSLQKEAQGQKLMNEQGDDEDENDDEEDGVKLPDPFLNIHMSEESPKDAHWHTDFPGLAMVVGHNFSIFKFSNVTFDEGDIKQ